MDDRKTCPVLLHARITSTEDPDVHRIRSIDCTGSYCALWVRYPLPDSHDGCCGLGHVSAASAFPDPARDPQ